MLLGYDKNGEIKFMFTDEDYLNKMFPNNTAKIDNFWKVKNHGLKELFIVDLTNIDDINNYYVENGKLKKKEKVEEKNIKVNIVNHIINTKPTLQIDTKIEPIISTNENRKLTGLQRDL